MAGVSGGAFCSRLAIAKGHASATASRMAVLLLRSR